MSNHPNHRARAAAFDDLLWQISGELAMKPASDSLVDAPWPSLEEKGDATEATSATHEVRRARRRPARGWLAGSLALGLALATFVMGRSTLHEPSPAPMNLAAVHAEAEFLADSERLLERMRDDGDEVIPLVEPRASALDTHEGLAPAPEPEPVATTTKRKRASSSKATTSSRKRSKRAVPKVSFEDL